MKNNITSSLNFLQQVIYSRLQSHFKKDEKRVDEIIPPVKIGDDGSVLSNFVIKNELTIEEYITLLIALVPHVQPAFFENCIHEILPQGGELTEFGAVKANNQRSIIPTGETVLFVLTGSDIQQRLHLQQLFHADHFFYKQHILWLDEVKEGEAVMSGRLIMAQEWVDKFLFSRETTPKFSAEFPAKKLNGAMMWDDLVLPVQTMDEIDHIKIWLSHNASLMKDDNLSRKLKPGYRALFYGPPGTGKTLTANLLGKEFNKDVYRIDLSQVVSKYIGETEKNLEKVFSRAVNKDWILFFDEADALFGKRTNVGNAHDRYANQEVSYLLQRVEDYPGLLILASNFKNNLDKAFTRRFHAMVHFPMPNAGERLLLWKKSVPSNMTLAPEVNINAIADQFELSGASILNVVQYASLKSLYRNDGQLTGADLLNGIRREFWKEEKTI
ncbi:MAG: ATP-binding protein [Ferruginibacter sp.]